MLIQILDDRLTEDMLQPKNHGDAGIDMYACIDDPVRLFPDTNHMINTGIRIAIPLGFVGLLVPRSSTGVNGFHLGNVIGIIDSQYRGDVMMNIKNVNTNDSILINPMSRLAQLVVVPHYNYDALAYTHEGLPSSVRGDNGFGSTGK